MFFMIKFEAAYTDGSDSMFTELEYKSRLHFCEDRFVYGTTAQLNK